MRFSLLLIVMLFAQSTYGQSATSSEPATGDTAKNIVAAPATESATSGETVATLVIKDARFCTGVENREPVEVADQFSSEITRLYFWSAVENSGSETTISHVWYFGGQEQARVALPIKPSRYRTWSSRLIPPGSVGSWKVQVVDSGGNVLLERSCEVK